MIRASALAVWWLPNPRGWSSAELKAAPLALNPYRAAVPSTLTAETPTFPSFSAAASILPAANQRRARPGCAPICSDLYRLQWDNSIASEPSASVVEHTCNGKRIRCEVRGANRQSRNRKNKLRQLRQPQRTNSSELRFRPIERGEG
jgi:hypothetical protein